MEAETKYFSLLDTHKKKMVLASSVQDGTGMTQQKSTSSSRANENRRTKNESASSQRSDDKNGSRTKKRDWTTASAHTNSTATTTDTSSQGSQHAQERFDKRSKVGISDASDTSADVDVNTGAVSTAAPKAPSYSVQFTNLPFTATALELYTHLVGLEADAKSKSGDKPTKDIIKFIPEQFSLILSKAGKSRGIATLNDLPSLDAQMTIISTYDNTEYCGRSMKVSCFEPPTTLTVAPSQGEGNAAPRVNLKVAQPVIPDTHHPTTIYVTKLTQSTETKELETAFSNKYGAVAACRILFDKRSGQSKVKRVVLLYERG